MAARMHTSEPAGAPAVELERQAACLCHWLVHPSISLANPARRFPGADRCCTVRGPNNPKLKKANSP
jgi:hypothetical protein